MKKYIVLALTVLMVLGLIGGVVVANGAGNFTVHNVTQDVWYSSIQTAINGADSGDEIYVYPADYGDEGTIYYSKSNLTLMGIEQEGQKPIIDQLWNFRASGTIIKNFEAERIRVYGSGVSDVIVEHNYANVISIGAGTNHSVAHNTLIGDNYYGITLAPGVTNTSVVHNYVTGKTGGIRLGDANNNADNNTVAHNSVLNGSVGVWVRGADNNILHNVICGNSTQDIRIQAGSINTHIHNNTFSTIWDLGENTRLRRNTECE